MNDKLSQDEILDRAMDLIRPEARRRGMTQGEYLVAVLEGRLPLPGRPDDDEG